MPSRVPVKYRDLITLYRDVGSPSLRRTEGPDHKREVHDGIPSEVTTTMYPTLGKLSLTSSAIPRPHTTEGSCATIVGKYLVHFTTSGTPLHTHTHRHGMRTTAAVYSEAKTVVTPAGDTMSVIVYLPENAIRSRSNVQKQARS